jgi:cytochrome P450
MKLTLHVICAGLYGYKFDWETADEPWSGVHMNFNDAIRAMVDNVYGYYFIPAILRKWLPFQYTRMLQQAYEDCGEYFRRFISLEKQGRLKFESGRSIISLLVEQSANTGKEDGLTEDEIVGNAFLFFLAGHESTYISSIT